VALSKVLLVRPLELRPLRHLLPRQLLRLLHQLLRVRVQAQVQPVAQAQSVVPLLSLLRLLRLVRWARLQVQLRQQKL